MPRKKLSLEQGKKLLEDTKTRLRLEQEARTRERIEQIEFERFDRLRIKLCGEYWTLEGSTDTQSELLSEEDEDNSKTNEEVEDYEMEEDNDSIPSGSEEGDFLAVEAFEIAWDCSISQVGREADWAPTAQAHRAAIDLLGSVLNSSTRCHLACIKTLNA